jgi:prepilin-type N-terminal cleavage/methylation domain-containing protein
MKITMIFQRTTKHRSKAGCNPQAGFTLIELMIATLVLAIGLTGGLLLILTSAANDNRSKMDSSATVLAQMTMEMIASVPANSTSSSTPSSSVTVTDCNPTSSSASHTINTLGTNAGAGAPLNSSGGIDFSQSTVSGYQMSYYACQASTGDRQAIYDVRWYVQTISADAKLVVVAAERTGTQGGHAIFFQQPVSLHAIVGL